VVTRKKDGKVIKKKRLNADPEGELWEFKYRPGKALKAMVAYNVDISVDMTPFFGVLTAHDEIIVTE